MDTTSARLPNAEILAALEEGDRIANDPTIAAKARLIYATPLTV